MLPSLDSEVWVRKLVIRMIVSHRGSYDFHSTLAQLSFMKVPDVLVHHVNIRRWRMEQSLRKTWGVDQIFEATISRMKNVRF